ncbi:beta-lactamase-like protein [Obelidium mucronatum]|nr:beta-lactamase-like protein [Obelidium mucronatum]
MHIHHQISPSGKVAEKTMSKASDREFIFLGTGTSSAVPNISCLTRQPISCNVCLKAATWTPPSASLEAAKRSGVGIVQTPPSFNKNKRNNTSGVYRYRHSDGRIRNILIDVGKTFYTAALQWFPFYGITQIDAVFITHGHADAVMGLDDLRQWTLKSDTQPERGPIQESIPIYLNKEAMAVIAGAFPYLVDRSRATGGGQIAALDFHVFDGEQSGEVVEFTEEGYSVLNIEELRVIPFEVEHGTVKGQPYYCLGFKLPGITYISDANRIPDRAKQLIKDSQVLVLDALRELTHPSHLSFNEAVELGLELKPKQLFFTDFCHDMEHEEMETRLKTHKELLDAQIKAAPAFDGLVVSLE